MRALLLIPFLVISILLHSQVNTFRAKEFSNITYLGTTSALKTINPIKVKEKLEIDLE